MYSYDEKNQWFIFFTTISSWVEQLFMIRVQPSRSIELYLICYASIWMSICNKNKLFHHKTIPVVHRLDETFTFCGTHWIPLMKNPVQFVCLKVSKYQQIYLNFTWLMNWTAMIMFAKTKIKKSTRSSSCTRINVTSHLQHIDLP